MMLIFIHVVGYEHSCWSRYKYFGQITMKWEYVAGTIQNINQIVSPNGI